MKYSEIFFQNILTSNTLLRFDSEYYSPEYLEVEKQVKNKSHKELRDVITLLTDYHANGSYKILRSNVEILDKPDYALMIRTVDFERDDFESDVKYISEHAYNFLKKTKVYGGEIIINKIGNAGKVYLVPPLNRKVSLGMNQFMIRPKKDLDNYFLYTFLVSKYGNLLLQKRITGAAPLSIDKESVRSVPVPILNTDFQDIIHKIIRRYFKLTDQSKILYHQAEQTLLSKLGLLNWKPKHELAFVKNYSNTAEAERIDAEYFQPFYDQVDKKLSQFNQKPLQELCGLINYGTVPTSPYVENGTPYIKGLNLLDGFIGGKLDTIENTENLTKKFYTKENDIVISQMGTVGKAGLITKNEENYLFASFTIRARLKDCVFIDPYVLTLFINIVARPYYLLRKIAQASVRQNTDLPTIKALMVPKLNSKVQEKIREDIKESRKSKLNSKSLLDIAKRGVEIAIEKNESEAEKWIKEEIKTIENS